MSKIERVLKELSDLRAFYLKLKKRKNVANQAAHTTPAIAPR